MQYTTAQIKKLLEQTCVYVPEDCEGIRVDYCKDEHFIGTGEETGEEYAVYYCDVDVENSLFYKLAQIDIDEVVNDKLTSLTAREITNLINKHYPLDVITDAKFVEVKNGTAIYLCEYVENHKVNSVPVYIWEVGGKLEADY